MMDELERVFREGLERHADRADVAAPVVAGARAAAARRRTTRVVLAAAAVLVVAGAGIAAAVGGSDGGAPIADAPSTTTVTDPAVLGPTRTEYWHNLQIDVPADWQRGSVPQDCGSAPVGEPYVGRPIPNTDVCGGSLDLGATPTAPYVWLGAGGPIGSTDLGDGWVRETVLVDGTAVSVASKDGALRRAILASAAPQDLCAPELHSVPPPELVDSIEGLGSFVDATLCAYGADAQGLVYASLLGERVAEQTFRAVHLAPAADVGLDCGLGETVTINAVYDDNFGPPASLKRTVVFQFAGCGVTERDRVSGEPTLHRITEATVRPWAGSGDLKQVLFGLSSERWSYDYFIGAPG